MLLSADAIIIFCESGHWFTNSATFCTAVSDVICLFHSHLLTNINNGNLQSFSFLYIRVYVSLHTVCTEEQVLGIIICFLPPLFYVLNLTMELRGLRPGYDYRPSTVVTVLLSVAKTSNGKNITDFPNFGLF